MRYTIRSYRAADAERVVALADGLYPEYGDDREAWRAAEQFDPRNSSPHQFVALAAGSGELVGYGGLRTNRLPWARLDLVVASDHRRRGVGGRLLAALEDGLHALGAASVHARVRADFEDALAFLTRRGFSERHRMQGVRLALDKVSYETLARHEQAAVGAGYAIVTLAQEMVSGHYWRAALRALCNDVMVGWPDPDPAPPGPMSDETYDHWLALVEPERMFLAKAADRYVGFSSLVAFGTAVHPAHRGRGVATALKARAVADAKRRGCRRVESCTAQPAMLAINEKLGYVRHRAEVRVLKMLTTASSGAVGALASA